MKTETTTLEFKETRYLCEEEGCNFSTTDERAAREHPWRKHKSFKKVHIDLDPDEDLRTESTLIFFLTEEDFEQYKNTQDYINRFLDEPWEGPGWYETWTDQVPCGRGCCTDTALFLRPATKTVKALKRMRQEIDETLEMLERMEVEHALG